ncbi:MAG: hypothetical protein FJ014_20115 [Chloroflexi bacterium]|nr:hypothetical protein [Chloroflexota bacterium]
MNKNNELSFIVSGDGGHQTDAGASGMAYAAGSRLHVWQSDAGEWWYCFSGVSQDGLAYESDDVGPHESQAEAIVTACDCLRDGGECDLIAWPDDRHGWLCVGVKGDDLFTANEIGWRELTDLGQAVTDCLEQVGEIAATLDYFVYSKQESVWPDYDVYVAPFERDLVFEADEHASFGWGVCFIPDIHVEQLNKLLQEREIHNVTFWWSRSNVC